MLYQLAFPETELVVFPVDVFGITRDDWYTSQLGTERVLGELARCGNQFVGVEKQYLNVNDNYST